MRVEMYTYSWTVKPLSENVLTMNLRSFVVSLILYLKIGAYIE